ncbi:DUF1499 domain-containing protein [Microvirga terricola]|uniref:DUF1499 domain-containing protein n=1 Tax=Microvirga terricola TaxID=2719797 RepID=A0ABX0VAB7_9HYPH|nr:DUF1499 domain-containing protein [Microvirga terricola]NIX76795.1 DUF1499 domain-containing protein [Microvirga terricola]
MRHYIIEEPVSRPATWSPKLAWFALAVSLMAAALIRFNRIDYPAGFVALGSGLVIALIAVGMSFVAFIHIWREGRRGLGSAVRGLVIAALVLAYPGWMTVKAVTLPPINDVSTDTDNPPAFSRSRAVLAARNDWVPPEVSAQARERQRQGYVKIAPLTLDTDPDEAFVLVREAANNLGWQVIEAVPPGGRAGVGRLDAIDRTLVLKLPEDVTVRVRPRADGARVDVRSASRIGARDLGDNAARIRAFLEETSNLALTAGN